MNRFLSALFPSLGEGYIEIRCLGPDNSPLRCQYVTSLEKAEEFARQWTDIGHVYTGVTIRPKKSSTIEDVEGGACNVVWADLDTGTTDPDAKRTLLKSALTVWAFAPSMVIDSGRGYHLYWLLNEPLPATESLSNVVEAVGKKIGGDTVFNINRLMRIPGTLNHKTNPPVRCRLANYVPALTYALSDIEAATRLHRRVTTKIHTGSKRGYKSRSERDWAIITACVQAGLSDDAIRTIFQSRNCGDKVATKGGDKYLEHTITQARSTVTPHGTAVAPLVFVEQDDCYYLELADGTLQQQSTFVFSPEVLLEGDAQVKHDALLGTVRAAGYTWPRVVLDKRAFSKVDGMLKQLPVAAWQWLGGDTSVRSLLPYLMDQLRSNGLPKKAAHPIVGRIGDMWIAPNQTITRDRVVPSEEARAVWISTGQHELAVDYQTIAPDEYLKLTTQIFELLPEINRPDVIFPVLGWYMAAPWKSVLEESFAYRFPSLNLFGTRGSGKTSLTLLVMQRLLGMTAPRSYDCNTTRFVLLTLLGSTNGIPISLSEFRSSLIRDPMKILRYLLLAYDSGHDPRGRSDQTIVDYELRAPVSIDGEDAISDAAARERLLPVNLAPETVLEGTDANKAFERLTVLPLHLFASRWIMHTLRHDPPLARAEKIVKEAFAQRLPDRVRHNITVAVTGLLGVKDFLTELDIPFPEVDADDVHWWFSPVLDNIVGEYGGRTEMIVDELVTDIVTQLALLLDQARPVPFIFKYEKVDNQVWFHLPSVLTWWYAERRKQGQPALGASAIKTQLRERTRKEGDSDQLGQYVASTGQAISHHGSTKWMFGIDLGEAFRVLDIPDKLQEQFTPIINGGSK